MKDNHGTINAVLIKRPYNAKTLIPARLLKHDGVNYLPQDQHKIGEVGGAVSNTIHAHYSKGASNHKDVLIIVKTNEYLQD